MNDKRKSRRHKAEIAVRISGMAKGKPFHANATALDVSWTGARLAGVHVFNRPGETIKVQCGKEKGLFTVVWVADKSSPEQGQIGLQNLNPMNWIWGTPPPPSKEEVSALAEAATEEAAPAKRPRKIAKVTDSGMFSHLEWRDNRRTHERLSVTAAVEIQAMGQELKQWGTCRDLSPRGCAVQTPAPLPTGCRVELTFRVNARQISVRGVVRNFTPNTGMGIEFLLITKKDQELLMEAGRSTTADLKLW